MKLYYKNLNLINLNFKVILNKINQKKVDRVCGGKIKIKNKLRLENKKRNLEFRNTNNARGLQILNKLILKYYLTMFMV